MRSATRLISGVVVVCIVAAAVPASASAAPPDDACSLLTAAQVGAALGVAVGAGSYVTPTFKKTCTWNATADGGGTVTLNLQSLEQYAAAKKSASYGNPVSAAGLGGIGDEAYYFGTDALVSLIAKKGSVAFKVAVYAQMPVEQRKAAEKALALQVVAHL